MFYIVAYFYKDISNYDEIIIFVGNGHWPVLNLGQQNLFAAYKMTQCPEADNAVEQQQEIKGQTQVDIYQKADEKAVVTKLSATCQWKEAQNYKNLKEDAY